MDVSYHLTNTLSLLIYVNNVTERLKRNNHRANTAAVCDHRTICLSTSHAAFARDFLK